VNYTLVGTFVLILGAALVAGVLWLASGGALRTKYDLYLAVEDESVAGLNVNAPVKYNGVDVGKVHSIAYVELSGGAPGAPPLRAASGSDYPVIRTKPSLSARIENVLTTVLAKLDSTSNNINAILSDENRAALKSTLADLATITHTVAARKDAIDASIASAARTLDNSSRASAQIGPVLDRVGRASDAVEKMGNEVARTSESAGKTVNSIGADLNRFTAETLPELERLLGELNTLSISLRRFTEQTERNPASLLFGRRSVPEGPGESSTAIPSKQGPP
jgi:phospholipid/cholesterol/gamma-HCH transport system substrate-binding protein